jgi:hypothetical protein
VDEEATTAKSSGRLPVRRFVWRAVALGLVENYLVGWRLHSFAEADHAHEASGGSMPGMDMHGISDAHTEPSPWVHFLRDSTISAPVNVVVLLVAALIIRYALARIGSAAGSMLARVTFAAGTAVAAALASVPSVAVHGWLFDEHLDGTAAGSHYLGVALITLRYTFALGLVYAAFFGVPWAAPRQVPLTTSLDPMSASPALKDVR